MKYILLVVLAYSLNGVAFLILVFRVGRPWHTPLASLVWGLSWIPLLIAGWIAGEEVAAGKGVLTDFVSTHWPYLLLLALLIGIGCLIRTHYKKRGKMPASKTKKRTGRA